MKKLILTLIFLSSTFAFAQISESSSLNSGKWTFGGSASINGTFGTYSTFGVSVAPRVGYKISENLEFGGIASFSLLDSDLHSTTLFGIGPYANYYFAKNFYATAQFQEYIITQKLKGTKDRTGRDEAALYIGGGYMTKVGNNIYMQIGAMYNVLWKENSSIFSSGFTPQVGVVFGL
jgi:hypothetical protein